VAREVQRVPTRVVRHPAPRQRAAAPRARGFGRTAQLNDDALVRARDCVSVEPNVDRRSPSHAVSPAGAERELRHFAGLGRGRRRMAAFRAALRADAPARAFALIFDRRDTCAANLRRATIAFVREPPVPDELRRVSAMRQVARERGTLAYAGALLWLAMLNSLRERPRDEDGSIVGADYLQVIRATSADDLLAPTY
jgi:hypothetical protein